MDVENVAAQPVMVRHIGPFVTPRDMKSNGEKSRLWKRAGVVAAAGALFGFAVSLWLEAPKAQRQVEAESTRSRSASVLVIPAESAPVQPTGDRSAEMDRLKTRNRRLEALVQVLQKRSQAGKPNPGLKIKN